MFLTTNDTYARKDTVLNVLYNCTVKASQNAGSSLPDFSIYVAGHPNVGAIQISVQSFHHTVSHSVRDFI